MADFFYPELDPPTVKHLLIVRQLISEHPAYLLDAPYTLDTETDLLALFKMTRNAAPLPTAAAEDDIDVEAELRTLYKGLQTAKPNFNDPDQMGYYRTATALLERLLALQSTARNIKTMSEHHTMVLDFIEEICSPTQVEEFLKRLKEAQ
jgi:hypothetical protein